MARISSRSLFWVRRTPARRTWRTAASHPTLEKMKKMAGSRLRESSSATSSERSIRLPSLRAP
jgi:hypothetical protein